MIRPIQRWLAPPVFSDNEDKTRRAAILNLILLATLALIVILLLNNLLRSRASLGVGVADAALLVLCLILRRQMRQGDVQSVSVALLALSLVSVTLFIARLGTVRAPAAAFYLLIVAGAGLLVGRNGITIMTTLSSLAIGGLIVAENAGLLPQPDYAVTVTQWVTYTALLAMMGVLTYAFTHQTHQTLQRAHEELVKRQQAEQEKARYVETLQVNEERLRRLASAAFEGIVITEDGVIVEANDQLARILGCTPAELLGRPVMDFVAPESRPVVLEQMRSGLDGIYEHLALHKDGTSFPIEIQARPFTYQGRTMRVTALRDITERRRTEQALHESEEKYRQLFEAESDAIFLTDNETGQIYEANAAASRIYGYTHAEFLALRNLDISAEPEKSRQSMQDRDTLVPIRWHRKRDGTLFPVELNVSYVTWHDRLARLAAIRDITARQQAEQEKAQYVEALRKSENLYRTLVETADDAILLTNLEGQRLYCNSAYYTSLGYESSADLAPNGYEIVHPDDRAKMTEVVAQLLESGTVSHEYRARHKDGQWIYRQAKTAVVYDAAHQPEAFFAIIRDVTKRKRVEETLRESEELLRLIAETVSEAFWVADVETDKIFYISPAYERLWETPLEQLYQNSRAFIEAIHIDDRARVLAELKLKQASQPFDLEYRIQRPDGTLRWIWDRGFPVREPDGDVRRYVGIAQDITERKQAEATLRESEENFRAFFNTIDHLLFVLDDQGRIILANDTVRNRLGYTESELAGQNVLLVHPPARHAEAGRIIAEMLAGQADYCPVPVQTKDGHQIPVETRVLKGRWSGQDVIFGVTKDLSALAASEEKFAKAFQASPALMAITDMTTNCYVEVNETFLRVLGFTRAEVIGWTAADLDLFVDPLQRGAAQQAIQQQGFLRDFEAEVRAKSGEVRIGLFAAEYLQLQDRQMLLTVMEDITERKHAEEQLRSSEQRLQQVIQQMPYPVEICDPQGTAIMVNPAFLKTFGIPAPDLVVNKYNVFEDPLTMRVLGLENDIRRVYAGEAVYIPELVIPLEKAQPVYEVQRTGSLILEVTMFPVFRAEEEVWHVVTIWKDITERKRVEVALQERQHFVQQILDTEPGSIYIYDLIDQRNIYLNQEWQKQFGYSVAETQEIGAELVPHVFHPADLVHIAEHHHHWRSAAAGETRELEYRARTKQGDWRWLHSRETCFARDAGGQVTQILGIAQDVTERKHAESQREAALEALRELNLTLEQRVAERTAQLQAANARLTELDRLKDEFIARVSHELRSPLANIKIHLALLTTGQPDKRDHYLKTLDHQTDRLHHLIENVLAFSELNLRDEDFSRELLDLNDLLQSRAPAWQRAAARHDLTFNLQLAASLPQVRADGPAIVQALAQVIDNALSYTRAGAVTVTSAPREMDSQLWVTVGVRDTGPGIAPAEAPHIFERFYRGRAAADYKIPGTGVGLSIARQLIERLGGHLTVESGEGQGATFTIWLPAITD